MSMSENVGKYGPISGSVPQVDDVPLKFQESTFTPGSSSTGKISSSSRPLTADDSFSTPGQGGHGASSSDPPPSRWSMLTIAYFRPYFDVDTVDVLDRLSDSIFPFPRSSFLEKTALNPDMYGPFWICATLVFVTAALGNLSSYVSYATSSSTKPWHYNINELTWAAALFFGYCGLVPLALFFFLRYLQVSAGLVQLWCLYGYSLFIFVPTSFLTVVPLDFIRWILVLGATCVSSYFLGINLKAQITIGHEMWFPVVVIAVILQCALGVVLKLYFFTYF